MSNLFGTRIEGITWWTSLGVFECFMKAAIPYLEKSCPSMAEEFQSEFNYCSGMGIFASMMSVDEEKHVLEALKRVYHDKMDEMIQLLDGLNKDYLTKDISHFRELIIMLEEEVRDIERGRLIVQEDGSAIVNENFKEE